MENTVLQWVSSYGYAAIFGLLIFGIVGIPVPDEFLLTGCGFLVFQGHLRLAPALASAWAGSACGITCSYLIGRTVGWKFLHSRAGRLLHIRDEHIRRVHDWFDRIGHWALLAGYFIPGVRHFTAIVAGTSKLGCDRSRCSPTRARRCGSAPSFSSAIISARNGARF